jgi:hypothetical protein
MGGRIDEKQLQGRDDDSHFGNRQGQSIGIFAAAKMAHLIDDETVAKMGHPIVVVSLDVGHPSRGLYPLAYLYRIY